MSGKNQGILRWMICGNPEVMCSKDADGMANSVDPDKTAPIGAI